MLLAAAPASAAPELVKLGDFTVAVHVASPPQDPRVFVVEQGGLVKIVGRRDVPRPHAAHDANGA